MGELIIAPPGKIWRCAACGKQSPRKDGGKGADRGWDASCYIHAVLVDDVKGKPNASIE